MKTEIKTKKMFRRKTVQDYILADSRLSKENICSAPGSLNRGDSLVSDQGVM